MKGSQERRGFDKNGDVVLPFSITVVKEGKFLQMDEKLYEPNAIQPCDERL